MQLDMMLQAYQAQSRFNASGNKQQAGSSVNRVADAYQLLGVSADSSDTVVKKAYRKLMSQHHPDKLMAQGVPAEMLEVAKRKTQDIQAAYELLKQQRGMR